MERAVLQGQTRDLASPAMPIGQSDARIPGTDTGLGKMPLKRLTTIFGVLLLLLGRASAETSELEKQFRKDLQEYPGLSVLFMDVKLLKEGSVMPCDEVKVSLVSDLGKTTSFSTYRGPVFLNNGNQNGGAILLRPGSYSVAQIGCKGTVNFNLNGSFAKFRVRPDAIVNAGSLVLDHKQSDYNFFARRTFSGRTSVEDLSPKTVESLKKRAPNVFAKATKNYMVPNPLTSN